MNKTVHQIADIALTKTAEYDEGMRKMVDRVAKQYKQYGVKELSASELEKLFKDYKLGQGSWQEHFQKSKWLQEANNAKMNFEAGRRGPASTPRGRPGSRSYSRGAGSYRNPFDPEDFKRKWSRANPDNPFNKNPFKDVWRDMQDDVKRTVDKMFPKYPRIGKAVAGAGLLGILGLGAYGIHQHREGKKLKDTPIPEDFSKSRRAGIKSQLDAKSQAPYRVAGGLAVPALAAGALLHAPGGARVLGDIPGLLSMMVLSGGGSALGGAVGKAINKEPNDKRLNAAIAKALASEPEDATTRKVNRSIRSTLGMVRADA